MPKLKTHKGTAKRIKKTSKGKLLKRRAFSNHFLQKKSKSRKRKYNKDHKISKADNKNVKKLLGE